MTPTFTLPPLFPPLRHPFRHPLRPSPNPPRRAIQSCTPPFKILSEKRLFHRYQTIYSRTVRHPNGQTVSYDLTGNSHSNFQSVFVFPFCTRTRTVTLLHEYSPGLNRETPSFVAGMFDPARHIDLEAAARAELSEEAMLRGGRLVPLCGGVPQDKYSLNSFYYFLMLDAEDDPRPGKRDAEEWIRVDRVGLGGVRGLVGGGVECA